MNVFVKLKRILSEERLAGRKYELICIGNLTDPNEIILNPMCSFFESVNSQTTVNRTPSSIVFSFPLCVKTNIMIKIRKNQNTWFASIRIDLEKWHFSIQPLYENSNPIPTEIASLLLASFGIRKKGKQPMSFAALASSKRRMESRDGKK